MIRVLALLRRDGGHEQLREPECLAGQHDGVEALAQGGQADVRGRHRKPAPVQLLPERAGVVQVAADQLDMAVAGRPDGVVSPVVAGPYPAVGPEPAPEALGPEPDHDEERIVVRHDHGGRHGRPPGTEAEPDRRS